MAEPQNKNPFRVKVYVVTLHHNVFREGQPNSEVIAVKLTHKAAQSIVDHYPGTTIQSLVADKEIFNSLATQKE